MIKCDSGPGHINTLLLGNLKLEGYYLYLSIPSTTAVSQETDCKYGPFKTHFHKNLDELAAAWIQGNQRTLIHLTFVGLTTFGDVDPISGHKLTKSAFQTRFSREACLRAWEKVSKEPYNAKCLDYAKVRKSDMATFLLSQGGYNGNVLTIKLKEVERTKIITKPHSKEQIMLLANATTHGSKFMATGRSNVMTEDFFKLVEVQNVSRILKIWKRTRREEFVMEKVRMWQR